MRREAHTKSTAWQAVAAYAHIRARLAHLWVRKSHKQEECTEKEKRKTRCPKMESETKHHKKAESTQKTFVCLVLWLVEQDTRERVMLVLRDKLVQTPSRKDGIAEDQEASLRQECVKFIRQMAGMFEM